MMARWVRSLFLIAFRAASVIQQWLVFTTSFLWTVGHKLKCTCPPFQSFLRRLQIWVNILDPTHLFASDVSVIHCNGILSYMVNRKHLMANFWYFSHQAEIQKAHDLFGSEEKLNEKVWLFSRLLATCFMRTNSKTVFIQICSFSSSRMDMHGTSCCWCVLQEIHECKYHPLKTNLNSLVFA